jgi:hypothetical protein
MQSKSIRDQINNPPFQSFESNIAKGIRLELAAFIIHMPFPQSQAHIIQRPKPSAKAQFVQLISSYLALSLNGMKETHHKRRTVRIQTDCSALKKR